MTPLVASLQSLVAVSVWLGLRPCCRAIRVPPPPLLLPLLASVALPWLQPAGNGDDSDTIALASALLGSYAAIQVGGWLLLELPPHLGWCKPIARILQDLLKLSLAAAISLVLIHQQLGGNLIGLATTSAVLTAVIGLAAQETLKDLLAGISLQIDAPFQQGDWVDLGATKGIVVALRLMSTRLATLEGAEVVVPNSRIANEGISRYRPGEPVGQSVDVGLGYGFPTSQAIQLLEDLLRRNPHILTSPRPVAWVQEYGDSAIVYRLQYWQHTVGSRAEHQLRSDLLEQLWYALKRSGQAVPYPVRELRSHQTAELQAVDRIDRDERARLLGASALFRDLTPAQLHTLAALTRCLSFAPQERVICQGDPGDTLYLVVQGRLQVVQQQATGQSHGVVELGPGEIFGEMSVCTGEPRAASVYCLEESILLEVERDDLVPLMKQDPEVLERLSTLISAREQRLKEVSERHQHSGQQALIATMKRLFGDLIAATRTAPPAR